MSRNKVPTPFILPKYTSGQIIAAMHTLGTLAELEKFYVVIRDNEHLPNQYRTQVKTQYLRRKKLLESFDGLENQNPPANETTPTPSV